MRKPRSFITPPAAERLVMIWAIVEAQKTFPAMIVVTSATAADDTGSIADGLAVAASNSGQRAGYLELGGAFKTAVTAAGYTRLSLDERLPQREAFDTAWSGWRSSYDVVIVNCASLVSQALGAHAVRIADGVVIGVCFQRRVVAADRELATLLSAVRASVIGVVMTGSSANPKRRNAAEGRRSLRVTMQPQ